MILRNIDCTEQYEAMKRGEWPEPHPAVVAAHRKLASLVIELPAGDRGEDHHTRSGKCQSGPDRDDSGSHGGDGDE